MSVERKWVYDRPGNPGEADGRKCIFCGKEIASEQRPAYWTLKAEEDNQDADFVLEDGYAHRECHEAKLAQERKGRFTLPEVP